jgi:amino acid permease
LLQEKGVSLAAFATTILFLILTVIMVSVTLQSAYAWLVMGSTLFLFLTLCSYSSCEKTYWQRTNIRSDSISTISEGRDNSGGVNTLINHLPL